MTEIITRTAEITDSNVEGRTVEAYASMFDTSVTINTWMSSFGETIAKSAFNKSLQERSQFPVFYNHGMDINGMGNSDASVPIGVSVEMRVDNQGLYTRSEYHKDPFADRILEAIRSKSITGQSFSGSVLGKKETRNKQERLESRVLTEIKLREYGPTPFPADEDAKILSVRNALQGIDTLKEDDRAHLIEQVKRYLSEDELRQLTAPLPAGAGPEPHLEEAGDAEMARRARVRARLYKLGVL